MTDEDVIARYKAENDPKWVGILYDRYAHLVLGLCVKYMKNIPAAQDMAAEIFESLFSKLMRYEVETFRSWIYQTSKNACLMRLRSEKSKVGTVRLNGSSLEIPAERDGLPEELRFMERWESLEKQLPKLSQGQQICIQGFYLEGLSYEELAERNGFSVKAVKSHIQNGRRRLKGMLQEKDGTDAA